jgi:uncharacterized protein (DUF1778 family)
LEARITANQKRLLQDAAAVQGRTLSDFVVGSLVETATRVLEERELVVLGAKDRDVFVRSLLAPPTLEGGRLAHAVRRHRAAP